MILEKLIIENFRQFYGKHEIIFSVLKKKNVTVIHAENGFGKTALLNALLWGFYGHDGLTEDLEQKDCIIHEALTHKPKDPEDIKASVTLLFKDEDAKYTLSRSLTLSQQLYDSKKTHLELEVQKDGETFNLDRPQWKLEALMPNGISPFLFFNGERIDHLARATSADKVTEAIYQMLGLNLLKMAIEDLDGNTRATLTDELREHTDEGTAVLLDDEKRVERELGEIKKSVELCKRNQEATIDEIATIDNKLQANKHTRDLQAKRAQLESERTSIQDKLREVGQQLAQVIGEDGYTLFAQDVVAKGKEITARLRAEGKIPARVLNVFLDDLLQSERCICTRELKKGSAFHIEVEKLKTIAGDQNFNNAVQHLDHAIGLVEGAIERTRTSIKQGTQERLALKGRVNQIAQTLAEIHEELGNKEDEEVSKLEDSRTKLTLKQREFYVDSGKLQERLTNLQKELEAVRSKVASSKQKAQGATLAQRRLKAVEDTSSVIQRILKYEMEDLRTILNKEINEHFKKVIVKDFWADLTEDFVLRIRKRVGGTDGVEMDVAKSQGENQITSLVFIASLVSLAERRNELPTILRGLEGGQYPICMDSPFGNLGVEYRRNIAQLIPELAPQVIVMVSPTQWRGEVEENLSSRIGHHYLLAYHGPKPPKDAPRQVSILGKKYTQYYEKSMEYTEIKELEA